jgi:serine/threonine protein phosphatase 1
MGQGWLERWKNLRNRFGGRSGAGLQRLAVDAEPAAIYVIGDVHGCLDLLLALEKTIVADAANFSGDRWIVMVGDVIDRGEQSAGVLDHLLAPPPAGLQRFCLAGNHEAMMLDFLRRPSPNSPWLEFGGRETLLSYGVPMESLMHSRFGAREARQIVDLYIPGDHVEFLESLPVMIETPSTILVHAGIRPGVWLEDQSDSDLIGYRDNFEASYEDLGRTVVHGHTIREEPLVTPNRIAIDTGAYFTGRLVAVRIVPNESPMLFSSGAPRPQQSSTAMS